MLCSVFICLILNPGQHFKFWRFHLQIWTSALSWKHQGSGQCWTWISACDDGLRLSSGQWYQEGAPILQSISVPTEPGPCPLTHRRPQACEARLPETKDSGSSGNYLLSLASKIAEPSTNPFIPGSSTEAGLPLMGCSEHVWSHFWLPQGLGVPLAVSGWGGTRPLVMPGEHAMLSAKKCPISHRT